MTEVSVHKGASTSRKRVYVQPAATIILAPNDTFDYIPNRTILTCTCASG